MAGRRILCSAILFGFLVAVCFQTIFYHRKSQQNVLSAYKSWPVMFLQGSQLKLHQNKLNCFQPRGRRHFAARTPYYANSDASFSIARLAISGDVQPNPGPSWPRAYREMQNTEHFDWSCPICTDVSNLRPTSVEFAEESPSSGGLYKELKAKTDYKGLKIAHLNVRGILNKIGERGLLLLDSKLDVLAITETHLKGDINSSEISVDGYKIARFDRMHKSCG